MTACPSIGSARGSSAVRRPDAWSHVITAAVPLRTAALHVSRRRLIQPGGDGSTITIWRSTYSAYETTVMCRPYDSTITVSTGPAAASGTSGLSSSSSSVKYAAASNPANAELLSIRR